MLCQKDFARILGYLQTSLFCVFLFNSLFYIPEICILYYGGGVDKNEKVITGIKRISKPGLRVYAGKDELPRVLGGLGIAILSTNQGVITDKEARKLQVGGEVLAFVW